MQDAVGEIWIEGEITEDTHEYVKSQLASMQAAGTVRVNIYSPGGEVYAGYGIYNTLRNSGKRIETIITGRAESMATFIALAGDVVKICNPSTFMIHMPRMGVHGTAESFEQGASELRNIENVMIARYAEKSKLPPEQIREMMRKETSMSAVQAKQYGFADEIMGSYQQAVALGQITKKQVTKQKPKADGDLLVEIIKMAADGLKTS